MTDLYIFFHLNLLYSSISEKDRRKVIRACYWPIFRLAEDYGIPVGIEMSALTLECVKTMDPLWVRRLKADLKKGRCEFIGSGYAQLIGPLVPAEVNEHNQQSGMSAYKKILGIVPKIALVNEQAYSSGLISHYLKAGYKAIIMEWNNPYRFHPEWRREWRHYPQCATGTCGSSIPVIWNDAIAFQKFQRYAQGDIDIEEYEAYLENNISRNEKGFFSLYGNDAEIFDFRPGRFQTEPAVHPDGEWSRINALLARLKQDRRFRFVLPSRMLRYLYHKSAGNIIRLESSQQPIPVKKQEKYNITRWAVTGRDDTAINTRCYKIYNFLQDCRDNVRKKALWEMLCYFWASDFRTHIEKGRWVKYRRGLNSMLEQIRPFCKKRPIAHGSMIGPGKVKFASLPKLTQEKAKLSIEAEKIKIVLNTNKGMAIDSLFFKDISKKPLIGTIPHGYYDDIGFGADFFSGHTIIEESGKTKVSDLEKVEPVFPGGAKRMTYTPVRCLVKTRLGEIEKEIRVYVSEPRVDIRYIFNIIPQALASIRTGIVTILPASFDKRTIYYRSVNGGYVPEVFLIDRKPISHAEPANRLISSNHCLGATEGWIGIGDKDKRIRIYSDKSELYSVPMISYQRINSSYFLRCYHSIMESDETAVARPLKNNSITFTLLGLKGREG